VRSRLKVADTANCDHADPVFLRPATGRRHEEDRRAELSSAHRPR